MLEELKLAWTYHAVEYTEIKTPKLTDVNPNGRVPGNQYDSKSANQNTEPTFNELTQSCPAIKDPNTNVTLWESGAIVDYLAETFDRDNTINFATVPEKFQMRQWMFFQASGQDPYSGQAAWYLVSISVETFLIRF